MAHFLAHFYDSECKARAIFYSDYATKLVQNYTDVWLTLIITVKSPDKYNLGNWWPKAAII
jgi:hypothetical protein